MSKRQAVGGTSDKAFEVLVGLLRKARKNPIWIERLEKMLKGRNPFEQVEEVAKTAKNWLQPIIDLERKSHQDFFGNIFSLAEFTKTLKQYGAEKVAMWKKLGLEPHFLPKVSMMLGDDYPGWEIKPEEWFYKQLVRGKIFQMIGGELQELTTINLGGITVLVDTRFKPRHESQYHNDWLSPIIEQLRAEREIQDRIPRRSRFDVSAVEIEPIKPGAAEVLGLKPEQLRLEREIEANVIPQVYPHMPRVNDGKTNTWEWREEFFGGRGTRLYGGDSDFGGLAGVGCGSASGRWGDGAFRFLAVL